MPGSDGGRFSPRPPPAPQGVRPPTAVADMQRRDLTQGPIARTLLLFALSVVVADVGARTADEPA